jgi:cobalt/nickel transport system permease protein
MHVPDGFVDGKTAIASGLLATLGLGIACRQVQRTFSARRVPLIGLSAAFIFAAQMLNFPVAGGTSGHLIGAVLAAVILGPSAAVLVMSSVLILQCLMFADGGLTALGANMFNMALVAPIVGFAIYRFVCRMLGNTLRARLTGIAFASWCSTVIASITCAGELALSGTVRSALVFPAMIGIHTVIGLGEALITTLIVVGVAQLRPELLEGQTKPETKTTYGHLLTYGVLVIIGLVLFVAPFASGWPDGLEKVAETFGFAGTAAQQPLFDSPVPNYQLPGIGSSAISIILAGLIGITLVFLLSYLLARLLTAKQKSSKLTTL